MPRISKRLKVLALALCTTFSVSFGVGSMTAAEGTATWDQVVQFDCHLEDGEIVCVHWNECIDGCTTSNCCPTT